MVYLDHAAATPVSSKALQAMLPYFAENFYNPSAPYLPAKRVREAYEQAKNDLAHVIGAKGVDLVMTAGATESINLAFTAVQGKILTTKIEHAAVLEAAKQHAYDLLSVDKNGLISLDELITKLEDDTVELVSVSLANNELGTIQPLAEIGRIIQVVRQNRLQRGVKNPLYLHSDASQALNLIDINVARLGVDLLTLNAAKCGGPKGVGALYVAHGVNLRPLSFGGGQERGLRSGTENVPGVIGFAVAAIDAKAHLAGNRKKYQEMADTIRQELRNLGRVSSRDLVQDKTTNSALQGQEKTIDQSVATPKTLAQEPNSAPYTSIIAQSDEKVNSKAVSRGATSIKNDADIKFPAPKFLGNNKHQLASFVPVCFPGLDAERLIYRLEQRGVLVSTGAACAANKGSKSHVLAAIGLSDAEIAGSLRISLGGTNTLEEVKTAAQIIREEVEREYLRLGRTK